MKSILAATCLTILVAMTGCSGEAPDASESQSASAAGELRTQSAATTRKAITSSFALFSGGDDRRTRKIDLQDAPDAVASKLRAAHSAIMNSLSDYGDASDLENGIFEVFKSPRSRKVIGYAVWAYGDNGDSGQGYLRGFDLQGKQIVDEEDMWSED